MTLETANRLYELRKKHNLSQEELAEKLGVSRQAVSKWERSEASPDTDNLIALAKIYDLSLDELIYGEKEEKKKEKAEEKTEENANEPTNEKSENDNEELFVNIDDGKDKVKIGPKGILVEDEDGEKVKISWSGIKIETSKKDDDDDDDDELYETVYSSNGKTKKGDNVRIKVKRPTRFWLEVPYPIICAVAYLIFGCYNICGGWALSWVIFITIPIYYTLVEAIYMRSFAYFAYPVFCAFVYLVCGLYFGNWHPSWIIFVTVPVYYPIADALDKEIRRK
ncbi:MAG: helix-turn-helix domain-containing protein [Clostridia bacterium]|nr:helix-turn-helix domain-containing protein [Clostridia bacterium]